jgi:23S rRNA pseudouridine2604 synthase
LNKNFSENTDYLHSFRCKFVANILMQENGVQINKYISSSGYCSRREAEKLIEQARVMINDNVALLTDRVTERDTVIVDFEVLKKAKVQHDIILAFNKPVGITSTTDIQDRSNIISFINYPKRIVPIGRLDKDSDGLILLTNNGDYVNKILRAGNQHEKEYIVTVNKGITPEFIYSMSNGVPVLGKTTLKCKVKKISGKRFSIVLVQGMNRQIRRMCEYLGYDVVALTRVRIMNIQLDSIKLGKYRLLNEQEMKKLNEMIAKSIS